MIDELATNADTALTARYGRAKSPAEVDATADALAKNGFIVRRAANAAEANEIVLSLIPEGAEVHHGASKTLEFSGIAAALDDPERYKPLRLSLIHI